MPGPGPNDHHFAPDPVTGVLVQKPGLGSYQPTEEAMMTAGERAAEHKRQIDAIDHLKADLRGEALAAEQRNAAMDAREAALAAREAELDKLTAPEGKRRALATERA